MKSLLLILRFVNPSEKSVNSTLLLSFSLFVIFIFVLFSIMILLSLFLLIIGLSFTKIPSKILSGKFDL